ncbi:membrane hypothetical protein [Candidatus Xenohaliotis californiensis]|uniref:HemY N-terminal domain-containing protein n=1 Tax=Candidatus Xenohaliotis californiensis TaxID=84677 RepID=A0ABM9N9L6_9RICK|nr:membrane hypothetical protein [Candidatus Xenohaliotis californiensis]
MLKAIKHLCMLIVILFVAWYAHLTLPSLNFKYSDYEISVSFGLILFCAIYICLFFVAIYNTVLFFLSIPKRFYDKHHNNRYEHGMIALMEAFIGILSDNLVTTKMFYYKARTILGDVAEVMVIKAYILLMENNKVKANIEFSKLLNYDDTRLLGIKFLKDSNKDINLDNLILMASKSLSTMYQPDWFKRLVLKLWSENGSWNEVIKYVDSAGRKHKKFLLPYKAWCLYNLAVDICKDGNIKKAKHILEELMLIDKNNLGYILEYSRVLYHIDGVKVAKKFLLHQYKLLKLPLISREIILILQKNKVMDIEKRALLNNFFKVNASDPWPLIELFNILIADRCYSEIDVVVERLAEISSTELLAKLFSLKLALLINGVNSVDLSVKIDIIINTEKNLLLDKSIVLKYNKFDLLLNSK